MGVIHTHLHIDDLPRSHARRKLDLKLLATWQCKLQSLPWSHASGDLDLMCRAHHMRASARTTLFLHSRKDDDGEYTRCVRMPAPCCTGIYVETMPEQHPMMEPSYPLGGP